MTTPTFEICGLGYVPIDKILVIFSNCVRKRCINPFRRSPISKKWMFLVNGYFLTSPILPKSTKRGIYITEDDFAYLLMYTEKPMLNCDRIDHMPIKVPRKISY